MSTIIIISRRLRQKLIRITGLFPQTIWGLSDPCILCRINRKSHPVILTLIHLFLWTPKIWNLFRAVSKIQSISLQWIPQTLIRKWKKRKFLRSSLTKIPFHFNTSRDPTEWTRSKIRWATLKSKVGRNRAFWSSKWALITPIKTSLKT